jgi:hypothetical protein
MPGVRLGGGGAQVQGAPGGRDGQGCTLRTCRALLGLRHRTQIAPKLNEPLFYIGPREQVIANLVRNPWRRAGRRHQREPVHSDVAMKPGMISATVGRSGMLGKRRSEATASGPPFTPGDIVPERSRRHRLSRIGPGLCGSRKREGTLDPQCHAVRCRPPVRAERSVGGSRH